jgi:lipopolysaccharide export system protein LptC
MPDDRRSRRVRFLKIALPAAAVALIAAVFLVSGRRPVEGLSIGGLAIDPAEGLRLSSPRFTGETGSGQPFVVTADWALPDGPDPGRVTLGPMRGQITLDPQRRVTLEAATGVLFPKDERLTLGDGVTVTTSDGYRATVASAEVDFGAEEARAEGPVAGEGPLGRIEAGAMRAARRDGQDYIWFERGVRVLANPAADRDRPAPQGDRAP